MILIDFRRKMCVNSQQASLARYPGSGVFYRSKSIGETAMPCGKGKKRGGGRKR